MRPYYPDHFVGRQKKSATATPLPKPLEPEADIPKLNEKEKERKGGGLWIAGSGSGPSGALLGSGNAVRVGASLVRPGFLGSGRVAAALSRMFGGPGTFLGGIFASSAGSPLVLGGMAILSGLLAAATIHLLGRVQRPASDSQQAMLPPGIASPNIVIDRPGDRSLGYVIAANEGELQWDKAEKQTEEAPAAESEETQQDAVQEIPKPEMPNVDQLMAKAEVAAKAQLKGDGFLKGLTNKGAMGNFGLGGDRLRDGLAGFNLKKSFAPKLGSTGKAKAMDRKKRDMKTAARRVQSGKSGRAMGQLKLARNMSAFGAKTPTDAAARQYSTDAFEQGRTIGGGLQGLENGSGIVVPPGDGATTPGMTDDAPDVPPGQNVTPYQPNVDSAKQQGQNSAALKILGMIMIAIGIALMAIGMALMSNHTTFPIGIALFIAGLALVILGAMLLGMSQQQGQGAKNQGNKVAQADGQPDQGANVNECADQAMNGTDPEACQASRGPDYYNGKLTNTVHEDVERERNATYTLE
ncbi:MAG: hypothetical protein WC728_07710 [Elusimicrobiota bacterium]